MRHDHQTFLRVKAVGDAAGMIFEGWATRGHEDRQGDIVMPGGARYELPLPVLAHHNHDQPVGAITSATVTAAGIRVKGKLAAGVTAAVELWELLKTGALSMSIGFRVLESSPRGGGGLRFTSWEWLETSLVSVPACPGTAAVAIGKGMAYRTEPMAQPAGKPVVRRASVRELEPQRPGETELQVLYRRFDAITAELPVDIARQCDFRRTGTQGKRFTLVNAFGTVVASANMETGIVTIGEPASSVPAPAKKQVGGFARRDDVRTALKAAGRYVREQMNASEERLTARITELESKLQELSDDGLRYRGFWRDGMSAKRGDGFTHDGSLWRANRTTEHAPSNESSDWAVLARKGRDAR
ncbi:MAG: HK97 family phage prohead protease [Pseudoxanthomonas sp.]